MNWYKWRMTEYAAMTRHLSDGEDLALRRIIDLYYTLRHPLPLDPTWTAKRIQFERYDVVSDVLQEFFKRTDEGWVYPQAEEDIANFEDKVQKARTAAEQRWMRTHSERNAEERREDKNREEKNNMAANADRFMEFWNAWPPGKRKYDKTGALRAWARYKLDPYADTIIAHVERQKASQSWLEGYIPAPTTYLNQARWEADANAIPVRRGK